MKTKIFLLNFILFLVPFNTIVILLCVLATLFLNKGGYIVHVFGFETEITIALFLLCVIFIFFNFTITPTIIKLKKMLMENII